MGALIDPRRNREPLEEFPLDALRLVGTLSLRGVSKPVTLTFTWTPGDKPVLAGKATVKRLEFGVGEGDWADTDLLPNEIAVSTKVFFVPAK